MMTPIKKRKATTRMPRVTRCKTAGCRETLATRPEQHFKRCWDCLIREAKERGPQLERRRAERVLENVL